MACHPHHTAHGHTWHALLAPLPLPDQACQPPSERKQTESGGDEDGSADADGVGGAGGASGAASANTKAPKGGKQAIDPMAETYHLMELQVRLHHDLVPGA